MRKYFILFFLAFPLGGMAKCTLGTNTTARQTIEIDMTSGKASIPIRTNLNDTFSCNATTDHMDYATPLQDYIVELKEPGAEKSIFMKLNLTGDGFPVSTGTDHVGAGSKEFNTQDIINSKQFILDVSYVESSGKPNLTVPNSNEINLVDPAISILSDNSCRQGFISWLICLLSGKLNSNVTYAQHISFTVKHKPTTCRFSQPVYEINMPDTTIDEILSADKTKSGFTNLVLNCDGVYNVTTNPVSFKVVRGNWDDSGTILKNTLTNGAKGVGFQIYNGTSSVTPLKLGDTLMDKLGKMSEIKNQYTFPITAKYVRYKEEVLQPGDVQSKAIFSVSYD